MGVGMLQSTLPLYLSELAPTQLRGFYINAYSLLVNRRPLLQLIDANFTFLAGLWSVRFSLLWP